MRRPSTSTLAAFGLLIGLGLSVASLLLLGDEGELRYTGVPRVEMALPGPAPGPSESAAVSNTATATEEAPPPVEAPPAKAPPVVAEPGPPVELDPGLVESGPHGPLPRIGPDGRSVLQAYARRAPPAANERPKVALLMVGLGLQAEATEAALALPGAVSLVFSPYAPDLPEWMERARRAGHEVLLGLPMEPAGYPDGDDPGPHTLLAGAEARANLDRLAWVLARGAGYLGVAGGGSRFAAAREAHEPVLAALGRRGLALVELGNDRLAAAAAALDLPYLSAPPPVDADPAALAIDFVLAGLETQALESGAAVGVAEPYPVTLERVQLWVETLADKGIELAPVSALLGGTAGLRAERRAGAGPAPTPHG